MNKYDELFDFRLARYDEIGKIMCFIRDYWGNPNHILATDEDFFRYEYCPHDDPDIYLAVDKKTDEIAAMHCLYLYSKDYVPGISDMSAGMFLANPTIRVPFVGTELFKRELDYFNPRSYISPGVNMKTSAPLLERFLHHKVERMKHFYLLGSNDDMRIAKIVDYKKSSAELCDTQYELTLYKSIGEMYSRFDDNEFKRRRPYKDPWYVERRYFSHPIYDYKLYGIGSRAVIVCREVEAEGKRVIRIVDILGDPLQIRYAGNALKELLNVNSYEYIDIYEQRMDDMDLEIAGFVERTENDLNVIPNYFEPFLRENIEIWVDRRDDVSFCFKGDGDQDRPNHR